MKSNKLHVFLILSHVFIALAIFALPFLSKIYSFLILVFGLSIIFINKNKNNEVLLVSAYMVGVEVFLRMTGGNFNNEYVKVCLIFYMFLGMIYSSFSKNAFIYVLFFLLLVPSAVLTTTLDTFNVNIRKILMFNLSGPVCLFFCAVYMVKRKILLSDLQNVLLIMGLPIITTTVYLFLYNPSVKDVVTGTQSNFETSGGFGPNQVSTILGLGIFIFFTQLVLFSKSKMTMLLNVSLLIFISYRAIVTFSRGGVLTALGMIICLLFVVYFFSNQKGRSKFSLVFFMTSLMAIGIWTYSSLQTNGLIEKRYANKDALGREKADRLGGREEIMNEEIKLFIDNPILGIGAGMSKSKRMETTGDEVASHNEITRLISEHGIFGIFAFLVLFITPLILYVNNRQHLYFLSFFAFWLLTINHAAMRTAAPAFVYALTLLSVVVEKSEKA
ncbi:O-antigen ligase family protein [Flavobacterium procerum]|uniref:O-antigen ligase family protein n=1 Tax=Flavobacterium procerum TaxID=1455569 RepID=A0ABV6BK78_9FLAO